MEDDLIFSQMEDDLNSKRMEDDLNFFTNGRRPHLFTNGRRPHFNIPLARRGHQNERVKPMKLDLEQWLWHHSG